MELPQEIEAFYIIPAVRRELARRLVEKGLSQREVAKKLGVTGAAISQYLSNKRATSIEYPRNAYLAFSKAVDRIKESTDETDIRREITALCDLLRSEKVICAIHKKSATVEDGCSSCFE